MNGPVYWFVGLAMLAVVSLLAGRWLGRGSSRRGVAVLILSLACVCLCAWFQRHPAAAVSLIPPGALQYLEGTAAVPFFMVILGVAWARTRQGRQRVLLVAGVLVAVGIFLQGGLWMIQRTPSDAFAHDWDEAPLIMQSQDYSCVSAASATALNLMGYHATELQMAQYTHTRPGLGATPIRAMEGLQRRLQGSQVKVRLVQASADDLALLPTPMLLTVNFDGSRGYNHMIVLMSTDAEGAEVADPQDGRFFIPWVALKDAIAGPAIVFERHGMQHAMIEQPFERCPVHRAVATLVSAIQ